MAPLRQQIAIAVAVEVGDLRDRPVAVGGQPRSADGGGPFINQTAVCPVLLLRHSRSAAPSPLKSPVCVTTQFGWCGRRGGTQQRPFSRARSRSARDAVTPEKIGLRTAIEVAGVVSMSRPDRSFQEPSRSGRPRSSARSQSGCLRSARSDRPSLAVVVSLPTGTYRDFDLGGVIVRRVALAGDCVNVHPKEILARGWRHRNDARLNRRCTWGQ